MALSAQRYASLVKMGYNLSDIMDLTGSTKKEVEYARRKAKEGGLVKSASQARDRRKEIIYQALVEAADKGLPCPSNSELAVISGFDSRGGAVVTVSQLEKEGRIRIKRGKMSRVITITETGRSTFNLKESQRDEVAEMASEGLSQSQIGIRMGLSTARVAQIWAGIKRDLGWQAQ